LAAQESEEKWKNWKTFWSSWCKSWKSWEKGKGEGVWKRDEGVCHFSIDGAFVVVGPFVVVGSNAARDPEPDQKSFLESVLKSILDSDFILESVFSAVSRAVREFGSVLEFGTLLESFLECSSFLECGTLLESVFSAV
jgi:hypothetical protein